MPLIPLFTWWQPVIFYPVYATLAMDNYTVALAFS